MSTASSNTGTYDVVGLHEARPARRRLQLRKAETTDRDALALAQVLGVLRQASPPPDVSWRQVARRLFFFTIVFALLLFGGTTFGGS